MNSTVLLEDEPGSEVTLDVSTLLSSASGIPGNKIVKRSLKIIELKPISCIVEEYELKPLIVGDILKLTTHSGKMCVFIFMFQIT